MNHHRRSGCSSRNSSWGWTVFVLPYALGFLLGFLLVGGRSWGQPAPASSPVPPSSMPPLMSPTYTTAPITNTTVTDTDNGAGNNVTHNDVTRIGLTSNSTITRDITNDLTFATDTFATAYQLQQQGNLAQAISLYTSLLNLSQQPSLQSSSPTPTARVGATAPTSTRAPFTYAQQAILYYNLGVAHAQQGQYEVALALLSQAAAYAPRDPDIRANLTLVATTLSTAQGRNSQNDQNMSIPRHLPLTQRELLTIALGCWFLVASLAVARWRLLPRASGLVTMFRMLERTVAILCMVCLMVFLWQASQQGILL